MLHADGKYATYLVFFSAVKGALNGSDFAAAKLRTNDCVVTGSDEETALVSTLRHAFPSSSQLYCMQQCKENVRHHLTSLGTPNKCENRYSSCCSDR